MHVGSNDASFNTGNGFNDSIIIDRHVAAAGVQTNKIYNPYKFSVYRNAAFSSTGGSFVKIPCDAKEYDTSSNVDIITNVGRFTAPIAGFYHFTGQAGVPISGAGADNVVALYKNGTVIKWGDEVTYSGGLSISADLQLAANDYIELWVFTANTVALNVTAVKTYFSGFLISAT